MLGLIDSPHIPHRILHAEVPTSSRWRGLDPPFWPCDLQETCWNCRNDENPLPSWYGAPRGMDGMGVIIVFCVDQVSASVWHYCSLKVHVGTYWLIPVPLWLLLNVRSGKALWGKMLAYGRALEGCVQSFILVDQTRAAVGMQKKSRSNGFGILLEFEPNLGVQFYRD